MTLLNFKKIFNSKDNSSTFFILFIETKTAEIFLNITTKSEMTGTNIYNLFYWFSMRYILVMKDAK